MNKYLYEVDGIERTPINSGQFKINENLFNEAGAYFFRKELSSNIKFIGSDYRYFKQQTSVCREFEFKIYKRFKNFNELLYTGVFSLLDCSFDVDNCTVEIATTPKDQYTCLLKNWEKEFNAAQVTDTTTVWEVESQRLIQFGLGYGTTASPPVTVFSIDGSSDPADYGDVVEEFATPYLNVTPGGGNPNIDMMVYCRELVYTACVDGVPQEPNGSGWNLESGCSISANGYGFSLWWRRYDYTLDGITFDAFTSPPVTYYPYGVTQNTGGTPIVDHGLIGLYDGTLTPPNLTPPDQDIYFDLAILRDFKDVLRSNYVKGGRDFLEVGNALLQNACGSTSKEISSEFFTDSTNYVTLTDNICANLQLWTKSDVANAQNTEALATSNIQASDERITLRDYLKDTKIHFNTEWYIDPNAPDSIILEHISRTRPQLTDLDLTTLDGGKWLTNKNNYSYQNGTPPIQETWRFTTASLPDFTGLPIDYNGCGDNIISYNTSSIDTELDILIGDSEQRALEGFILVQTDSIKSTDSLAQTGILWSFYSPNMPLSISNLQDKFWKYQRKLPSGRINNITQNFISYDKLVSLNEVNFTMCNPNTFDRRKLVVTQYGNAEIVSTSYDLSNEAMTLNLNFNL